MTVILGPLPCINCRRPVFWDRVGVDTPRLMETFRHDRGPRSHVCPPTCGVLMVLAKEPCGRARGHSGSHRSRWAMDNQARTRRKWTPVRGDEREFRPSSLTGSPRVSATIAA